MCVGELSGLICLFIYLFLFIFCFLLVLLLLYSIKCTKTLQLSACSTKCRVLLCVLCVVVVDLFIFCCFVCFCWFIVVMFNKVLHVLKIYN